MGGFHLSTSSAIDQPKTCYRTTFAISSQHVPPEIPVTDGSVAKLFDPIPNRNSIKWLLGIGETCDVGAITKPRQDVIIVDQAAIDNPAKVCV